MNKLIILIILLLISYAIFYYKNNKKIPFTLSTFNKLKGYTNLINDQSNWNYTPGGIPKIIIKTGRFKRDSFPDTIKDIFLDLMNQNPEYQLYYFDNDECDQFMKDYSNDVFKCYDKLIPGAFKADFFRVSLLEKYGGCYSDLSHVILVPLNDILLDYNMVLVRDNTKTNIYNAFMCTIPNYIFFKQIINAIINNIINNYYGKSVYDITGPSLVGKVYMNFINKKNIKLNDNNYDNIKIKILAHNTSIFYILKYQFSPITDNNKKIINTKFRNYRYITYKSEKIPSYGQLWRQRKIYK